MFGEFMTKSDIAKFFYIIEVDVDSSQQNNFFLPNLLVCFRINLDICYKL